MAPTAHATGDLEQQKSNLEDTIHKNAIMRIDFSLASCRGAARPEDPQRDGDRLRA